MSNRNEKMFINKAVYLGFSILELSKILMYVEKVWWKSKIVLYGFIKFHCSCKTRWCWNWNWNWCWFDTSNFDIDRPFPKGKYKTLIEQMKDELRG